MKNAFLPSTTLGRWSVGLGLSLIFFYIIGILIVTLGHQTGGDTFFDNLYISIPMCIAGLSGIGAFFTGIIGLIKFKERAVLTLLSTGIGLLVIMLILGEVISPD